MNAPYELVNSIACAAAGIKPRTVISAPVKLPNMAIDTSKLKGLYEYEYESALGLHIDCYLEYEEEYDGGNDEPSYPESITLVYALVNGVDISEVIDPDTQATIEEEALSEMRADADSHDEDRAIAQWEDGQVA